MCVFFPWLFHMTMDKIISSNISITCKVRNPAFIVRSDQVLPVDSVSPLEDRARVLKCEPRYSPVNGLTPAKLHAAHASAVASLGQHCTLLSSSTETTTSTSKDALVNGELLVAGEAAAGNTVLSERAAAVETLDWAPRALVASRNWPSTFWEVRVFYCMSIIHSSPRSSNAPFRVFIYTPSKQFSVHLFNSSCLVIRLIVSFLCWHQFVLLILSQRHWRWHMHQHQPRNSRL